MAKTPEGIVQEDILEWLASRGIFHWRNNTGAFRARGRVIKFGYKGSPDIIAIVEGFFLGIEVKVEGQKQNEDQKIFELNVLKSGGFYIVATNTDTVSDEVDRIRSMSTLDRTL